MNKIKKSLAKLLREVANLENPIEERKRAYIDGMHLIVHLPEYSDRIHYTNLFSNYGNINNFKIIEELRR